MMMRSKYKNFVFIQKKHCGMEQEVGLRFFFQEISQIMRAQRFYRLYLFSMGQTWEICKGIHVTRSPGSITCRGKFRTVKLFQPLTIFRKSSIIDAWQAPQYATDLRTEQWGSYLEMLTNPREVGLIIEMRGGLPVTI